MGKLSNRRWSQVQDRNLWTIPRCKPWSPHRLLIRCRLDHHIPFAFITSLTGVPEEETNKTFGRFHLTILYV